MARSPIVFMFSGQGSQYYHMGRPLYEHNSTFRDSMRRLDGIARELCGRSIVEPLYDPGNSKSDAFDRIVLTNPAIFMVEYSLAQCLKEAGVKPDMVLGSSLGSFAAATVAEFIGAEDALSAVIRLASILEDRCEPGGMLAIFAEPTLYREEFLANNSEIAAINFSTHFVISAQKGAIASIALELQRRNLIFQQLPVGFAFHSRWIDSAFEPVRKLTSSLRTVAGTMPLLCCDRAAPITALEPDYFWKVARNPIRFGEAIAKAENVAACRYIDIGPSGTLATFLKYTLPKTSHSRIHSVMTPFARDIQHLDAVIAAFH